MPNLLDLISSLSAADARSGQGRTVRAAIKTSGFSQISEGLGGVEKKFEKGDIIGIVQESSTIKVTAPTKSGFQNVVFTKVSLNESFFSEAGIYVGYLWFNTTNIEFTDDKAVRPVSSENSSVALDALYVTQVSGARLRTQANLTSKYRVISYGDIVGYTDNNTAKFLTTVFWKVFSQTGEFIGYVAKNEKIVSKTKPQAKALPKINQDGTTEQDYANVTLNQDPQSGNASKGTAWYILLLYFLGGIALVWFVMSWILGKFKTKPKDGK